MLIACDEIEGQWHQHYLAVVAGRVKERMTECEFASLFDRLDADWVASDMSGSLLYEITPIGRSGRVCISRRISR